MELGLPWGTKPRLILAHLNAEALRRQSPVIEVESSLSAFVKRIRGFQRRAGNSGFQRPAFPFVGCHLSGLPRHAASRAFQMNSQVVTAFELWPELDERQRVLWPSTIQLSLDYFNSLQEHAVPLNEADLAALAHSALCIDLYCWLAQRLHRVIGHGPPSSSGRRSSSNLAPTTGAWRTSKRFFRKGTSASPGALQDRAVLDLDDHGITLHNSLPPVTKRLVSLPRIEIRPRPVNPWEKCHLSTVTWSHLPRSLGPTDSAKTTVTWSHNPIVSTYSLSGSCRPVSVEKPGQVGMRSAP